MPDRDPSPAGPPAGWPHQPADPGRPEGGGRPPWTQRGGDQATPAEPRSSWPPGSLLGAGSGAPTAPPPAPKADRRRLVVIVAVAAVLLLVAVTIGVLVTRSGEEKLAGPGPTTATPSGNGSPPASSANPGEPGKELTLLAGKVIVAARPGWQGLENNENNASVRLALRGPNGRELLSTLTIVTLSGPEAFDAVLKLDGGTGFEAKGTDGPIRVTVQPGLSARIAAAADRPKAAFLVNISLFALDQQPLDVPTLRTLFTEQIAPALRFP